MTSLPLLRAAALAGLAALAGCSAAPVARTRADAGATAACRARTESAFNRQNRYLLSERDTSASPFSTTGTTGITTQGLSQRYALDTQMANCLQASGGGGEAGTGTAFNGDAAGRTGGPVSQ